MGVCGGGGQNLFLSSRLFLLVVFMLNCLEHRWECPAEAKWEGAVQPHGRRHAFREATMSRVVIVRQTDTPI